MAVVQKEGKVGIKTPTGVIEVKSTDPNAGEKLRKAMEQMFAPLKPRSSL
jgi:hypothetical protein